MISLHLEAETPLALYQQMAQIMVGASALMAGAVPGAIPVITPAAEEKPKRGRKAKTEEAPAAAEQGNSDASAPETADASDDVAASPTATDASPSEVTPASLRARAM